MRSNRHRLAVPPSLRTTVSRAWTRCGKSSLSARLGPPSARVRQRADQKMRMLANTPLLGRSGQLKPVELDLLPRRVGDHRLIAALGPVTWFAVRTHLMTAQSPRERRVPAPVTEFAHLVVQRRRPHMRIISKTPTAVLQERHELIWRLTPLTRDNLPVQIGADRLAVTTQMPGNRRNRPPLTTQSMSIHVFLQREHPGPRTGRLSSARRLSATHRGHDDTPDKITRRDRTPSHEGRGDPPSRFHQHPECPRPNSGSVITGIDRAVADGDDSELGAAVHGAGLRVTPTVKARREAVEVCCRYLTGHLNQLHYDTALARGWPIATGAVEGACRHLIGDRLDITGARWGLVGAEAVLRLRALIDNGDLDAYWRYHARREHQRLYPAPHHQQEYGLTA